MTHTLQDSLQAQLEEVASATARFGRQVLTIDFPDPQHVRSDVVECMRARVQYYDYKIDNRALAEAIIDRVRLG
jgi:hypothetical protein